jgi:hypothetical protein
MTKLKAEQAQIIEGRGRDCGQPTRKPGIWVRILDRMAMAPKHLWSGDWHRESGRLPASPRAVEAELEPAPATRRRWNRRDLVIAVAAAVSAAAVTLAVVASLGGLSNGSSRSALRHHASNPYGATVDWLGMQIGNSPTGVFINAMNTSGAAIVSGLEPGDQIVSINNHAITNVPEIRLDTNRLKIGSAVEITVLRSSVEIHSQLIPMMQRPTIHR